MGRIVSRAHNGKHFGEVTISTKEFGKDSIKDAFCLASFLWLLAICNVCEHPLLLFVRRVIQSLSFVLVILYSVRKGILGIYKSCHDLSFCPEI